MNEAASINHTFHASISKCCSDPDQLYSCGGFRWCFEKDLIPFQQRCRFVNVMEQLLQTIPRNDMYIRCPISITMTENTRQKIGETMKQYYQTDAGKENKKKAHEKRSQTMNTRREQLRNTITEKQCRVCQKLLPVSSFCKKSASSDGLQPYCKPCTLEKKKSYRLST